MGAKYYVKPLTANSNEFIFIEETEENGRIVKRIFVYTGREFFGEGWFMTDDEYRKNYSLKYLIVSGYEKAQKLLQTLIVIAKSAKNYLNIMCAKCNKLVENYEIHIDQQNLGYHITAYCHGAKDLWIINNLQIARMGFISIYKFEAELRQRTMWAFKGERFKQLPKK